MLQDLRYAYRAMARRPLISFAAVLTLGLGIAGATTVFSVVEAVLLRPLPFPDADRLVRVWELTRDGERFPFSAPNYSDLQMQTRTFASVAAFSESGLAAVLHDGGEPRRITAIPVSASVANVLGVQPQLGRVFTAEEERAAGGRHVVLSDALWRSRFGADPRVLGRTITLDDSPHIVTGVLPRGFDFPGGADTWVSLDVAARSERDNKDLAVIGRLAPGVTLSQARDELRQIARRLSDAHPVANSGWSADAIPFTEWVVMPRIREALLVLLVAVGVLLLLACANLANLLVAQAVARRNEIRVRAALGAARLRLVRQMLTESALLAALGTAVGVLIAAWSLDLVQVLAGGRVPRLEGMQIGGSTLAFAAVAGAVSCMLFGLAPAMHASKVDLRSGMDEGGRFSRRTSPLQRSLVIGEVALALVLVVTAGLLAKSFVRLISVDPGFEMTNTVAVPLDPPARRYSEDRTAAFYADLLQRVRALPGVANAAITTTNPFRQPGFSNNVTPEDRVAEAPPSGYLQAGWRSVSPQFFETMRIPMIEGRSFTAADRDDSERVAIVSVGLARRLWPNGSAVGKRIFWGGTTGRPKTIVGVSGDIRDTQLDAAAIPMLFVPHAQVPVPAMTVVVRSAADPASVSTQVRSVIREMDPGLAVPAVESVADNHAAIASGPRLNMSLLGAFAAIALVLAVTGVYALLAFSVAERRQEIAVRVALGASGGSITRLVLLNGATLTAAGLAVGTVAAALATRLLSGLLFSVPPTDVTTFVASAGVLGLAAVAAAYLPARQAARIDALSLTRN